MSDQIEAVNEQKMFLSALGRNLLRSADYNVMAFPRWETG